MKILKTKMKELAKYHAANNRPHLAKQWEKSLEGLNLKEPVFYWFGGRVYCGGYALEKAGIEVNRAWRAKTLDQESKKKVAFINRKPTFFGIK